MKLQNERRETVYKYDMDYTVQEADVLKKMAIERFANDPRAQLEYAVLSILSEAVDSLEGKKDDALGLKKPSKSKSKKTK